MKKLLTAISFILMLAVCIGLCACGGNKVCTHKDGSDDNVLCDECGENIWASYSPITIEQATIICNQTEGAPTTERYYIAAKIDSIKNPAYGQMTVSDATGTIDVYGSYSADGEIGYASLEEKPYAGDWVLIYCSLQTFNGAPEVKSAWIIDYSTVEEDISDYTEMSIADAREAATGTKAVIEGVVARITYANGKVPSGVILVDGTSSIYVYDGDIAGNVQIGNKIKVAASKTYWILDTEINNANKFGYKGCNQLENAILVSNDKGTHDFDKSWITETTVKEIMDTPVTEDITSLVYKVTALVKKAPGSGFVNYYLNDLDETTGSYVYTQCNGSDFEWLDEFDGKICTVYITALNAKSTDSSCLFRFIPVKVEDNGYTFDTAKSAEFAVKYYGIDQFLSNYTGDPALEVITSVSSELLGFENATLSYKSDNESIIKFETTDGKTVMHCVGTGTATVTVTGSYGNENTYEKSIEITVTASEAVESITVIEAINATNNTELTVKGIVGPSIVHTNIAGFYLMDNTGAIAVYGTSDIFKQVNIGDEVIIRGTKILHNSTQICISESEVITNNYGANALPTDIIVTNKTISEAVSAANTATVYTITGTVGYVVGGYSKNYTISDGTTTITLYGPGSESDYSFLQDYVGKTVTLDIVICNWNGKQYKVSAISVHTDEGKIYNEYGWNKYNK